MRSDGKDKPVRRPSWPLLLVLAAAGLCLFWASRAPPPPQNRARSAALADLVKRQNATIEQLRGALATLDRERAHRPLDAPPPPLVPPPLVAPPPPAAAQQLTAPPVAEAPEAASPAAAGPAAPLEPAAASKAYAEHYILSLPLAEVRSTPVQRLLARYGKTHGPGACERDFGNDLIKYWRGTKQNYCAPRVAGGTKLDCFLAHQNNHKGGGDQLCHGERLRFNFRDLADGRTPQAYFKKYVDSKHQQQFSKIAYTKGSLAGTCDTVPKLWKATSFPGWNVNWFNAFKPVEALDCEVTETAPTLIVERDTFANFFHNSEDFINTFIALAVLGWPLQELQILVTDLYPRGPFWPMWASVFFGGREPLTAWDIAQKYGQKNVCFENAAIAILGAAAPITVASWNTPCSKSALVRAYSDLVIAGLGLREETRYALAESHPPKHVTVTFMARRSNSEWPEKRFCDSATSFFDCSVLQHLGIRKVGRSVRNDADLVQALRKGLEGRSFGNGAVVTVQDVDYSDLSFEDQIRTDLATDVMVGPHGAGLMHNIFMPDRAALVELFIDGSSANRHFHNLARWQGRRYAGQSMANPIPPDKLVNMIAEVVGKLDLSTAY
ncbi:hypothetical protein M885DRAFT_528080 [Pelagophyceae sp. CCMP2097]|nr:hypothetical protein M885DRAFT_528080 [Pelagophyceae sp. CCMP2097]